MNYYLDGKTFTYDRQQRVQKCANLSRWEEAASKTLQIARYNIKRNMTASYYLLNPASGDWVVDRDYIVINPSKSSRAENVRCMTQLQEKLLSPDNIRGSTPLDRITRHFSKPPF